MSKPLDHETPEVTYFDERTFRTASAVLHFRYETEYRISFTMSNLKTLQPEPDPFWSSAASNGLHHNPFTRAELSATLSPHQEAAQHNASVSKTRECVEKGHLPPQQKTAAIVEAVLFYITQNAVTLEGLRGPQRATPPAAMVTVPAECGRRPPGDPPHRRRSPSWQSAEVNLSLRPAR